MGYCGPRGIPHSFFLGGPYLWQPDDRDKALAWHLRELERCPDCGTHPDDWDPDRGGDLNAFVAGLSHCRGCEVKAGADDQLSKAPKGKHRRGTKARLKRPKPEQHQHPEQHEH